MTNCNYATLSLIKRRICNLFGAASICKATLGTIYKKIKVILRNKRKALFVGTPCQVMGLRNYLGHDDINLFTVDLICHGAFLHKSLLTNGLKQ